MVWGWGRRKQAGTAATAIVAGRPGGKPATPIAGSRTPRISSVAYAEADRLSDAKTANAVGLPSRSSSSCSVWSGGPRIFFLRGHRKMSGGNPRPGTTGTGNCRGPAPVLSLWGGPGGGRVVDNSFYLLPR